MKRLLLTLAILTSISSLHGMEKPNKHQSNKHNNTLITFSKIARQPSTITLQIYHHLKECLVPDIAQHIFSLIIEPPSPITLPQIYHHLAQVLDKKIAQHIFSLQPGKEYL